MISNTLPVNALKTLQFELVTNRSEVYSDMIALREFAQNRFSKVSKIFRVFGEACKISGPEDVLTEQKILGTCILVQDNKVASVPPTSIIGFSMMLPNGNLFHLGFATHSSSIKFRNSTLRPSLGKERAAWCGMAETLNLTCNHALGTCEGCVQSHALVCEILSYAEKLGILVSVSDPTGFWETRNLDNLTNNFKLMKEQCSRLAV